MHHLNPTSTPLCWCDAGVQETYSHLFFNCEKNNEAGQALLRCCQAYDGELGQEKALRFEIKTEETFLLPTTVILATCLKYIWETRKIKKSTSPALMRRN